MSDCRRNKKRCGTRPPRSSPRSVRRPSGSSVTSSGGRGSTPRSMRPAGGSFADRRSRERPWPPGWSRPSWRKSSAEGWPTSRSWGRRWRPNCAGSPVRQPASSGETVGLGIDLGSPVHAGRPGSPGLVAIDAHGCDHALFLTPDADGYRLERIELGPGRSGLDLTRPSAIVPSVAAGTVVAGSIRLVTADDLTRWTALGLALSVCRPGRGHARRRRPGVRLCQRTHTVRRRHRVVPGRPAHAGGRLLGHGGSAQHHAARRMGGGRPPSVRRAGRRGGRQGVQRPGRPRRVRDRHSGARRHGEHVGVPGPRLPAPGPALERRLRRCQRQPGARPGATME